MAKAAMGSWNVRAMKGENTETWNTRIVDEYPGSSLSLNSRNDKRLTREAFTRIVLREG